MKKVKYLISSLPLLIVSIIHLVALQLEKHNTCVVYSKLSEPCLINNVDFDWFITLAFFNLLFGWLIAIYSIFKIGKLLGQDLPKPWGNKR